MPIMIEQPILKEFLNRGLVISPWLMMNSQARFDAEFFTLIDHLASDMVETYWTEHEKVSFFNDLPLYDRFPRTALYEIIASTAMSIAHYRLGDMEISREQVMEAVEILKSFISDRGFGSVLNLYWLVTSFENMQALHYYRQIPERIFTMGTWHRPWVDYSLSDELFTGIFFGNYKIEIIEANRYVILTEKGKETYKAVTKTLEDSGYLVHRVRQLQIHNFTLFQNYAELTEKYWPNTIQLRKDLLRWIEMKPGMHVLELGCADGVSTYESGLVDLIGEHGHIDAIDPSMGMIYRANKRKEKNQTHWVHFHQAKAENLPFADETFDAVIAFFSLQFMDLPQAFAEIKRVLRPGGWFTSMHAMKFNMLDNPILKEWYAPVVNIARNNGNERPRDVLKPSEETLGEFRKAGFIDIVDKLGFILSFFGDSNVIAHYTFRGIGWMQEELSMIPWQAREDIIAEVVKQGKVMCEKYTDEERMVKFPMQMIKGKKQ